MTSLRSTLPGVVATIVPSMRHLDPRMEVYFPRVIGHDHLFRVGKYLALARPVFPLDGQVVKTEDDVLRRHDDRPSVGGRKDVVGGHHEHPRLGLGLYGQRDVHGHLVPVKVRVVGGADEGVQLDGLAVNQLRLKGLYAEPVERRAPC